MKEQFTKKELYEKLNPALNSKVKSLKRIGINYVKKEDIWNYLSLHVWVYKDNLTLHDLVNDILELSNMEITTYVKSLMEDVNRPPIF